MVEPGDFGGGERMRNSQAIEDLVAANASSNETMLALVESVRKETAARDRKIDVLEKNHRQMNYLVLAVCAAVVLMLGLGIANAFNIATTRKQQGEIKQYNLTSFYCARTNPATGDPKGEAFLKCMALAIPNGPTLELR